MGTRHGHGWDSAASRWGTVVSGWTWRTDPPASTSTGAPSAERPSSLSDWQVNQCLSPSPRGGARNYRLGNSGENHKLNCGCVRRASPSGCDARRWRVASALPFCRRPFDSPAERASVVPKRRPQAAPRPRATVSELACRWNQYPEARPALAQPSCGHHPPAVARKASCFRLPSPSGLLPSYSASYPPQGARTQHQRRTEPRRPWRAPSGGTASSRVGDAVRRPYYPR